MHLVDVGDAVFPDGIFPLGRGERVFEDAAVAVERGELTGFFRDVHLREQVVDAALDGLGGVFVDVFFSVLVEIDPNGRFSRKRGERGGEENTEEAGGARSEFHERTKCG